MSSLEDAIRLQEKLAKQFSYLDRVNEVASIQSTAYFQVASVARNLGGALQPLADALQRQDEVIHSMNQYDFGVLSVAAEAANSIMHPIIANYESVSAAANLASIAASLPPINCQNEIAEAVSSFQDIFSSITSSLDVITPAISVIENLGNAMSALNFQTSDSLANIDWDSLSSEMQEDIRKMGEEECDEEFFQEYEAKWGEKGKQAIASLVKAIAIFVFSNFWGGYIGHCSEPIYKMMDEVFIYAEQSIESKVLGIASEDTEVTIWSSETQDFIEVSYSLDDTYYQGYMKKEDLENNTKKISDGVQIEQIVYINECTSIMAEYWDIDCAEAYVRLNEDTNTVTGFLIPNYDVISKMQDNDIATEIDQYYQKVLSN